MKRFLSSLVLSVFCLGIGSALAADAITTGNVNVRNGPSPRYRAQVTLPAGYPINIQQCRANWCLVNAGGYKGWISARYIAYRSARHPVRPYVQGPAVAMPFIIGGYSNYYYRNRHYYHRPRPPVYHRPPPPAYHRPPPPAYHRPPPPAYHRPPPPAYHRPPPPAYHRPPPPAYHRPPPPAYHRPPPPAYHRPPPPAYHRPPPPVYHRPPPPAYQRPPHGYQRLPSPH